MGGNPTQVGGQQNLAAQPYGQPAHNRGLNTTTVNTINGPTTATGTAHQDRSGPAGSGPYGNRPNVATSAAQPVAGQPLGAGSNRPSRRDQLASGPEGGDLGIQNSTNTQLPSARGSPASLRGRGGPGRGRGVSRSYNTSPSGFLEPRGAGTGLDEYGQRHVPQSISTSAFTVGGVTSDHPPMDRMDRTMDRMGDPHMDRMGRGGVGGMGGPMDRGGGMGGMGGMDPMGPHHRSSSMGPPPMHGRSRSASRGLPAGTGRGPGYHSLDRDGYGDREFVPIREPRERSLDRDFVGGGSYGGGMGAGGRMMDGGYGGIGSGIGGSAGIGGPGAYGRRERSLDRRDMLDPHLDDGLGYNRDMGLRSGDPMLRGDPSVTGGRLGGGLGPGGLGRTGLSPNPIGLTGRDPNRDAYFSELNATNSDLQRDLANLKKELELTNQKLGSSMHSIKTFWSPELKKERALRKEESAKYSLINDQLKLLNSENQKQAMLVRQLEEEVVKTRAHAKETQPEIKHHIEGLQMENDHLTREVAILKETLKELEMRIETQKQTLQARDESIKKLLEMLQSKGEGKEEEARVHQHMHVVAQRQLEDMRVEVQRKEQDLVQMQAKMKTVEEQHADYQRHIAVLKESLIAKEEHYNMLQIDVDELRGKLEEKNKL